MFSWTLCYKRADPSRTRRHDWSQLFPTDDIQPTTTPNDPRLLLAIWVWATVEGESSARRVDTLCRDPVAYRWLCGGVSMNDHSLSDFRSLSEQLSQQNAAARKERQKPPRVSTTDPEARVRKFSDKGFRPGYNVHFASDTQSRIIVERLRIAAAEASG